MSTNILFVCTGNTCRSPMAEYILKERAGHDVHVRSAGVFAFPGQTASPEVLQIFEQQGINMNHESQMVTDELMQWADLVLTMTRSHSKELKREYPQFTASIHPLKEYVDEHTEYPDITDPIGSSLRMYEATRDELEDLIKKLLQRVDQLQGK